MNKKEIISIDQGFLKNVSEVLEKARKNAKIVINLKLMRRFYNVYSHDQIGETVFTQFENLPADRCVLPLMRNTS